MQLPANKNVFIKEFSWQERRKIVQGYLYAELTSIQSQSALHKASQALPGEIPEHRARKPLAQMGMAQNRGEKNGDRERWREGEREAE